MDFERLKIKEYEHWTLYLHENQAYLGRTYLWAKRDDDVDLVDADADEREELFRAAREVKRALERLFQVDRMNYAALSNTTHHLHVHLIPRYVSQRTFDGMIFEDRNQGRNYAPYDKRFSIPDETLLNIRDAIRSELD